jgi:hypothetical protein
LAAANAFAISSGTFATTAVSSYSRRSISSVSTDARAAAALSGSFHPVACAKYVSARFLCTNEPSTLSGWSLSKSW